MDWYVTDGNERVGPVSEAQVVTMIQGGKQIAAVAQEGTTEWRNPSTHAAFADALTPQITIPLTPAAGSDGFAPVVAAAVRALRGAAWGACSGFAIYDLVNFEQRIVHVDSAVQQCVVGVVAIAEMLTAYIVARAIDRVSTLFIDGFVARRARLS